MDNKKNILLMMCITVTLITLAIVSLATADWVHASYGRSLGLWQFCINGKCESFPFKGENMQQLNIKLILIT